MDFVLSKVAMSVCALLVVSVLSGAFNSEKFVNKNSELESITRSFCLLVERIMRSGSEVTMTWTVPFLTTGKEVRITISNSTVWARAEEKLAAWMPSCQLHTWAWDGAELNSTMIKELDSCAPEMNASSGHSLELRTQHVLFESETTLMVFVSPDG